MGLLPSTSDPHIGFVLAPTTIDRGLSWAKGLVKQWHILAHPTIEIGMVDLNASFFHHILEPAVADRIRYVPAYASQGDLPLKMAALEIDHRRAPWRQRPPS